ncbi:MAG: recombinase family protein [Crocinitomicaceae bacterium]
MKTIGYIRVSSEQQDLEKQRHLLLEYAHQAKMRIDEFIEVEISSRKTQRERRITELSEKLQSGDRLIVAELSRLGRNMIETLTLINNLDERGVKIIFIRQPELSTNTSHAQLLLAIYSYFAQTEREFISLRTKQGLAAVKAKGQQLGRPKGSRNKTRPLDAHQESIKAYLKIGLSITAICKLVNEQLDKPLTYNSYKYFIKQDNELSALLEQSSE